MLSCVGSWRHYGCQLELGVAAITAGAAGWDHVLTKVDSKDGGGGLDEEKSKRTGCLTPVLLPHTHAHTCTYKSSCNYTCQCILQYLACMRVPLVMPSELRSYQIWPDSYTGTWVCSPSWFSWGKQNLYRHTTRNSNVIVIRALYIFIMCYDARISLRNRTIIKAFIS